MSHFFAYLSRMRFIRRWGLMHSTHVENIQEHSLRVAMIAHALAIVRNRLFGGAVSPERPGGGRERDRLLVGAVGAGRQRYVRSSSVSRKLGTKVSRK